MNPFDLTTLDAKLQPIQLGDNSIHECLPLDAAGYRLLELAQKNLDDGSIIERLVKRILPSISEAQYDALTPIQIGFVIAQAQGTLEPVLAAIKKELAQPN